MGTAAVASVHDGLKALEIEKEQYETRLQQLGERKMPLDRTAAMAKAFVENWSGLGRLLAVADDDQKHAIVRHFVEVIEQHPSDRAGKQGTYLMRLYPEARLVGPDSKTTTAARC
jgi:hypothetical protein